MEQDKYVAIYSEVKLFYACWEFMMLKRPKKKKGLKSKPKRLARNLSNRVLQSAAEKATYARSEYHCVDPKTGRIAWRAKPATRCPDDWAKKDGQNAVRSAIVAGRVSASWIKGFPRHIWHQRDGVWYEGRTGKGTAGEYHGYPIEPSELPVGLSQ